MSDRSGGSHHHIKLEVVEECEYFDTTPVTMVTRTTSTPVTMVTTNSPPTSPAKAEPLDTSEILALAKSLSEELGEEEEEEEEERIVSPGGTTRVVSPGGTERVVSPDSSSSPASSIHTPSSPGTADLAGSEELTRHLKRSRISKNGSLRNAPLSTPLTVHGKAAPPRPGMRRDKRRKAEVSSGICVKQEPMELASEHVIKQELMLSTEELAALNVKLEPSGDLIIDEQDIHGMKKDKGTGVPADKQCPVCGKLFSQKLHLQRHVKSVHDHIRDNLCTFCGKGFLLKSHLMEHIRAVHFKIKNHVCPTCKWKFNRTGDLNRHIKNIHVEGKKPRKRRIQQVDDYPDIRYCDNTAEIENQYIDVVSDGASEPDLASLDQPALDSSSNSVSSEAENSGPISLTDRYIHDYRRRMASADEKEKSASPVRTTPSPTAAKSTAKTATPASTKTTPTPAKTTAKTTPAGRTMPTTPHVVTITKIPGRRTSEPRKKTPSDQPIKRPRGRPKSTHTTVGRPKSTHTTTLPLDIYNDSLVFNSPKGKLSSETLAPALAGDEEVYCSVIPFPEEQPAPTSKD